MRFGLAHKIFGGYLVLIAALVAVGGYGGVTLHRLMGDYRSLVVEGIPAQRDLDALKELFRLQTANEKKFYVVRNQAFADLFTGQNAEWQVLGASLAARFGGEPEALGMDVLLAQHRVYARLAADNMAQAGIRHDTGALIDMITAGLDDLSRAFRARQDGLLADTQKRAERVTQVTIGLGLAAVALGLAIAFGLSALLTRPVRRLKAATEEVAAGIFDQPVQVGATDEIGDLGHAFNRMAGQLQALDELREEFIAYISHELKTPLTSLKEANALLTDGVAGPLNARQRKLVAIIHEDGEKIQRLITELLDLSKMEAGMMAFDKAPAPFAAIVRHAVDEMCPVAEQRRVALRVAEGGQAMVLADAQRVRQVLTNLISNAIKFSPQGAEVTVSWLTTGSRVACAVADRGPGIPADSRERIFEKFHQLAPSALSGMRGTGLGLPIARKIVEAHGGRLWVDCPPEGGSVFRFSLPVHAAPAGTLSAPAAPLLKHANG